MQSQLPNMKVVLLPLLPLLLLLAWVTRPSQPTNTTCVTVITIVCLPLSHCRQLVVWSQLVGKTINQLRTTPLLGSKVEPIPKTSARLTFL